MIRTKYLIIGGGITGLAFAERIKNQEYLIIERECFPGGYCKTFKEKGFTWDYAGHFFHFSDEAIKRRFESTFRSGDLIENKKNTKILYKGTLVDYPFQMNIHQLTKKEMIECLYDLFTSEETEGTDFVSMLYSKFGASITNKFLKPYNEKLYACDLSKLDKDAMGRFFPYADREKIIRNMKCSDNSSYNSTFLYHRGGAQVYVDALLSELNAERILTETSCESIDLDNRIVYTSREMIQYEYLINTAPFDWFIRAAGIEREENDFLSANKVLVFNVGFNRECEEKFNGIHWMYVPDKRINFYRIGFYNHILNEKRLSVYIEIGFPSKQQINVEKEYNKTIVNMHSLGIITDQKVEAYNYVIMDPAYVHISEKSKEYVKSIKNQLSLNNAFSIGRYGSWTYCSIEDSVKEALQLVETVKS